MGLHQHQLDASQISARGHLKPTFSSSNHGWSRLSPGGRGNEDSAGSGMVAPEIMELAPGLMTSAPPLGPTWWMERTHSHKLSCDL